VAGKGRSQRTPPKLATDCLSERCPKALTLLTTKGNAAVIPISMFPIGYIAIMTHTTKSDAYRRFLHTCTYKNYNS